MLLEGDIPGTSQEFHDLGLQECSYVTRGDIPGSPRDIPGLPQPGTIQECSYVTRGDIPGSPRDILGLP